MPFRFSDAKSDMQLSLVTPFNYAKAVDATILKLHMAAVSAVKPIEYIINIERAYTPSIRVFEKKYIQCFTGVFIFL